MHKIVRRSDMPDSHPVMIADDHDGRTVIFVSTRLPRDEARSLVAAALRARRVRYRLPPAVVAAVAMVFSQVMVGPVRRAVAGARLVPAVPGTVGTVATGALAAGAVTAGVLIGGVLAPVDEPGGGSAEALYTDGRPGSFGELHTTGFPIGGGGFDVLAGLMSAGTSAGAVPGGTPVGLGGGATVGLPEAGGPPEVGAPLDPALPEIEPPPDDALPMVGGAPDVPTPQVGRPPVPQPPRDVAPPEVGGPPEVEPPPDVAPPPDVEPPVEIEPPVEPPSVEPPAPPGW